MTYDPILDHRSRFMFDLIILLARLIAHVAIKLWFHIRNLSKTNHKTSRPPRPRSGCHNH